MKRMLFRLFPLFFALVLIATGCGKNNSDFEGDQPSSGGSDLLGEGVTVSSDFDWSTTTDVDIAVNVDDQYSGAYYYTVEVFDANPIVNPDAALLGKGVANQNNEYLSTITVPKTNDYLYIRQTSPTGRSVVKVTEVSGNNVTVNFGQEVVAAVATRSAFALTAESATAQVIDDSSVQKEYTTPTTGLTQLTAASAGSLTLESGKNYIIPQGETYTGSLNFSWTSSESYLYVEGTWHNTSSSVGLNGWKVIVQNGGQFTTDKDVSLLINNNSGQNGKLVVASGGDFNTDGNHKVTIEQNYQSGSQIVNSGAFTVSELNNIIGLYNYGTMTTGRKLVAADSRAQILNEGSLTIDNEDDLNLQGTFENTGTLQIKGKLYSNSSTFRLANSGTFEVRDLEMQGTIQNDCKFIVEDEAYLPSNVTLNISTGAIFQAKKISVGNSRINLESGAILQVDDKITTLNAGASYLNGPSSGEYALARLREIKIDNWSNPTFSGNLEIESSHYPRNFFSTHYNVSPTVRFVAEGESTVEIASTDCNSGGNLVDDGGTPTSPDFPIIESAGTYTYLFEDTWPMLGDYDMNDLVLDVQPTYSKNNRNRVTSMTITATLRAAGGTNKIGAAIQLDGVTASAISNVSRESSVTMTGEVFKTTNGLESGQTYAVIPLFDEAHAALGVSSSLITNTNKGGGTADPREIRITVTFADPVDASSVSISKFNVFIVNDNKSDNREEVHLAGYQATDKADKSKFGTGDDNSNAKLYTSKENLIWSLAVPGPFSYPVEWKKITDAYPDFKPWVISSGTDNKDWYLNPQSGLVY